MAHDMKLSDFRVGDSLGRGATSTVYQAFHIQSESTFALKSIDKQRIREHDLASRIRAEVSLHSQLQHRNIVKLYSFFEDSDAVYLVLEFCPNGSLHRFLKANGSIPIPRCREWINQLVHGIRHLHNNSILHRDLKLSNLLLDQDYVLKIADFGMAAIWDQGEERNTICGTPNFIAPEIIQRQNQGPPVDIWSLGVIIYTMIVGSPPFESENIADTFAKVTQLQYSIPSHVPNAARDLISKLLTSDPSSRLGLDEILQHPFLQSETPRPSSPSSHRSSTSSLSSSYSNSNSTTNTISTSSLSDPPSQLRRTPQNTRTASRSPVVKHPQTQPKIMSHTQSHYTSETASHSSSRAPSPRSQASFDSVSYNQHSLSLNPSAATSSYLSSRSRQDENAPENFATRNSASDPSARKTGLDCEPTQTQTPSSSLSSFMHGSKKVLKPVLRIDAPSKAGPGKSVSGASWKPNPLPSTLRLQPLVHRNKNGHVSICADGQVRLVFETMANAIVVSPDGCKISIGKLTSPDSFVAKECYSVNELPEKYHKKYIYIANFVDLVRSKTPKVTIYANECRFMMMENNDVDCRFKSGHHYYIHEKESKVTLKLDGELKWTLTGQDYAQSAAVDSEHRTFIEASRRKSLRLMDAAEEFLPIVCGLPASDETFATQASMIAMNTTATDLLARTSFSSDMTMHSFRRV